MRRNKLDICLHFVWATWDRLPLVTEEIEREVYRCLEQACCEEECKVLAVGGMPDHVHVLLLSHNTATAAGLMNHLKGGSSRFVTETLRPASGLPGRLMTAASQSAAATAHAEGNLWPDAEETNEIFCSCPAQAGP